MSDPIVYSPGVGGVNTIPGPLTSLISVNYKGPVRANASVTRLSDLLAPLRFATSIVIQHTAGTGKLKVGSAWSGVPFSEKFEGITPGDGAAFPFVMGGNTVKPRLSGQGGWTLNPLIPGLESAGSYIYVSEVSPLEGVRSARYPASAGAVSAGKTGTDTHPLGVTINPATQNYSCKFRINNDVAIFPNGIRGEVFLWDGTGAPPLNNVPWRLQFFGYTTDIDVIGNNGAILGQVLASSYAPGVPTDISVDGDGAGNFYVTVGSGIPAGPFVSSVGITATNLGLHAEALGSLFNGPYVRWDSIEVGATTIQSMGTSMPDGTGITLNANLLPIDLTDLGLVVLLGDPDADVEIFALGF